MKYLDLDYYNNKISDDLAYRNIPWDYNKNINENNLEHIKCGNIINTYIFNKIYDIQRYLIIEHGIYFFKYFCHYFYKLKNNDLEMYNFLHDKLKNKYDILHEQYPNNVTGNLLDKIIQNDINNLMYIGFLNDNYLYLTEWIENYDNISKCKCCGKKYDKLLLPDWVYYGSNGNIDCCFQCDINTNPTEQEVKNNLEILVNKCRIIPNSNFDLINHQSTIKIPKENWLDVYNAYLNFGGLEHIKEKYNTWFEALVTTGLLPDGTLKTSRGIKCLSKSGNICLSLGEYTIDNYLYDNGFKYNKEPYYPKHKLYNKNGKKRSDWIVGEYYIEFFGMYGDKVYNEKIIEKTKLVDELGLKMIPIYPNEIGNLKEKFTILK